MRALRDFRGVAGFGGFGEIGLNAAGGENAARFIEQAAAPMTTISGVGVVDQQRVLDFRGHLLFGLKARGPLQI